MINENNNEELVLDLPNRETIPCLTCKHGMHNFLALYCLKYDLKPKNVYYNSEECENYEPIIEKDIDNVK